MNFEYHGIDVTIGVMVTAILLVALAMVYLYTKENRAIFWIIGTLIKPRKAELKKDTTNTDWLLFILMLVGVVTLSMKLVSLTVVMSNSMVPEFQRGDMILEQSIDKTPQLGDIITFNTENRYAESHRVVGITSQGYIKTKGDNSPIADDYQTTQKDVIGKAIIINNQPVVIKGVGALFITDYSAQGVTFTWGDKFTFMQQVSATIKAWGFIFSSVAIIAYITLVLRRGR
jgi:signal peptidase I